MESRRIGTKSTVVVFALLILILLIGSSFAKAKQTSTATPVTAVFTDHLDDSIRSDGRGAYLNGVDGVQSIIDSFADFILQLHYAGKKSSLRREMFFDFTKAITESGAINRGTFYEDAFLNVDSIGTLAIGQSRSSQAQFNTQVGLLRFNPEKYPGTSYVLVTRTSATTWVITASGTTGGDVAALVQQAKGNTFQYLGSYHMPFQITVQIQ